MNYSLRYTEEARRALRLMPGNYRQRVRRLVETLADVPRPPQAQPLRDMPEHYRIRIDHWRLIYRVDEEGPTILVLAIRRKTGPETYANLD